MMRWPAICLLLFAAVGLTPAWALESAPVRSDRAVVTLITDTDHVAVGTQFHAGLRLRMAPGWHTYWLNPGDAGTTPELHLTLPAGVTAGPIEWPAPQILREGPVVTYSYEHEVVLPVTVTVARDAALPLHLAAHAEWLVCASICVPEQGDFTLDLPAGTPAPSAQAPLFAATDRLIPRPAPFTARVAPDGVLSVTGPGLSAATVADAWFLPSVWGPVDQSAPEHFAAGPGGISIALKPGRAFKPGAALDGVLGVRDRGGQASYYTIAAAPGAVQAGTSGGGSAGAAPETGAAGGPGLVRLLGFALLGGLILNLMPCVFPILAIKALSLARGAGQGRRAARAGALAYLGGVLAAFAALGALLLGARAAGSAAGWGFQFQSPAFVAGMAFVLFAVGLNLSGVFEVGGGRLAGTGQALTAREGLGGSFFTGLLAVVVATPCTAPFMGAAVAAAVAAPVVPALAIFLALGVGLAAPYVLLAFWPGLARRLPRPGMWMDVLKQALAFPMYAATAWLVWVVSQQTGPAGLPFVLGGLVLVGAAAWAVGLAGRAGRAGRRAALAVALAAAIAAVLSLPGLSGSGEAGAQPLAAATDSGAGATVEPYSDARLAALRAEGRPVFVNMTAAWCVSCLVNERVALGTASVRDAFARHGIAYLKGDWTRQDPAVTAFLRAHGRDGVPLYVFYPSGHAPAVVLPQILTPGLVLDAIGGAA